MANITIEMPQKALDALFPRRPQRYTVLHGGRGSAKSWSVATALVALAHTERHRILCAREFQASIAESVHNLIVQRIDDMGLSPFFDATDKTITSRITGSEFLFKGLRRNIQEIKSTEGVTICWVEEAQAVREEGWKVLVPTIRMPRSRIIVTYNPMDEKDATHQRFVIRPRPNATVVQMNWSDNPWFPPELEEERKFMLATDPDAYDWIWQGATRHVSEASIFRNRFVVEDFDTPEEVQRFFYGLDFGFANDPNAFTRSYMHKGDLWIDYEAFGYQVEIDDLPAMLAGGTALKNKVMWPGIPGAKEWPIKADNARPETISYLRGQGFNIAAAKKWPGCVEDRISYLKSFGKIHIHSRCPYMQQEARLYSYKVDPNNEEVLPLVVDKHNHGWDSVGYALDDYITQTGALGPWRRLMAAQEA